MERNDKDFIARKIRSQYVEKESTELDALKALDAKVKRPANVFAYTFGTVGSLVLGTGMSLAMGIIGNSVVAGIVIGCVGIAMVSGNYLMYKKILQSRKQKYAKQVLELSEKVISD